MKEESSSSNQTGDRLIELASFEVSSDIRTVRHLVNNAYIPKSIYDGGLEGVLDKQVMKVGVMPLVDVAADRICCASGLSGSVASIILDYVPSAPYFGRSRMSLHIVERHLVNHRRTLTTKENRALLNFVQASSPSIKEPLARKYLRSVKPSGRGGRETLDGSALDEIFRTKLHGYQQETILFIRRMERLVTSECEYKIPATVFKPPIFRNSPLAVDWPNERFLLDDEIQPWAFKPHGCLVANDVGLGKSLTAIGHILLDSQIHSFREMRVSGISRCPSGESHIVRLEGRSLGRGVPKVRSFKIHPSSRRIKTTATLIVCPSHVVEQWRAQFELHMRPATFAKLRALCVTSRRDLQRHFMKFPTCDVVVASVQLLQSERSSRLDGLDSLALEIMRDPMAFQCVNSRMLQGLKKNRTPPLGAFFWKRVVVDEFHEMFSLKSIAERRAYSFCNLLEIRSAFRLVLSATPFPDNFFAPRGAMRYLFKSEIFKNEMSDHRIHLWEEKQAASATRILPNSVLHSPLGRYLEGSIMRSFYCRFTLKDTAWSLPPRREKVIFVTMHPIEAWIYRHCESIARGGAYDNCRSQLLRLCAHPFVNNYIGDEILPRINNAAVLDKALHSRRRGDLYRVKWNLVETIRRLSKKLRRKLKVAKQELAAIEKKISEQRKKSTSGRTFAERSDALQKLKGHLHRKNGLKLRCSTLQREITDARKPLSEHEESFAHVKARKRLQAERSICRRFEQLEPTRPHWRWKHFGSKICCLLDVLQQVLRDPQARVITFTQYPRQFACVSLALEQIELRFVPLKGNVKMRNKSVRRFKDDAECVRVMLLSLDNTASGLDLIVATHVILLDQPAGSPEERAVVETQAIGRVHRQGQDQVVQVIRLVMRDTVEEALTGHCCDVEEEWRCPRSSSQWKAMGYEMSG